MQRHEGGLLDNAPDALVYQRYAPALFAYMYRQTASREDAEDILLEVFLAALERGDFLTASEKEQQAWLWRVARNKVADHYRRFICHPSISLKEVTETIDEDEEMAPEQVALRQEEYARLHTTLKELSPLQQEVLQLRFGHGLTCPEIALVVEKSEGAVRMLLSRTLKQLRSIYTKQEEGTL